MWVWCGCGVGVVWVCNSLESTPQTLSSVFSDLENDNSFLLVVQSKSLDGSLSLILHIQPISKSCVYLQRKDTLQEGMAIHSSMLAWRILWREENNKMGETEISSRKLKILREHFGEGNGTPLQYSCLENLMDRRAW